MNKFLSLNLRKNNIVYKFSGYLNIVYLINNSTNKINNNIILFFIFSKNVKCFLINLIKIRNNLSIPEIA